MTKWIVSTPLKGTNLMKNFVCFGEAELRKLLEQYPDATVEMKDSHLEDYPEVKNYSLISAAQTENYIQVKDVRYTLDEFNRIGELLLGRNLTDDQQVVMEWLKESCNADDYTTPMLAIYKLYSSQQMAPNLVFLTAEQQYQVLAAFANYGLEDNQ